MTESFPASAVDVSPSPEPDPAGVPMPRVAILGATGKMGRYAVPAVEAAAGLELVARLRSRDPLQAVLDAGGRLLSDASAPAFWVVEDGEGNRSCICTSQDRA